MPILKVTFDGVRGPTLDIVSIPGLPLLYPEYQLRDNDDWLKGILSYHFPSARSMCFHYDFAKILVKQPCWTQIIDCAIDLLYSLRKRRARADEAHRPLIFLCQSFGAVILKHALSTAKQRDEFRDVFECTAGIFFLACLHDERQPDFERRFLRCATVELGLTKLRKHDVTEALRLTEDWQTVKDVLGKFRELNIECAIRTFCESKKTVYRSRSFAKDEADVLCSESEAFLGLPKEKVTSAELDHVELSRLPARSHPFFETLLDEIREVVDALKLDASTSITPTIASAGLAWQALGPLNASLSSLGISVSSSNDALEPAVRAEQARQNTNLPCRLYEPFIPNPDFIGREDIIREIRSELLPHTDASASRKVFVLSGLGGIGKTQTALRYMFDTLNLYEAVLWVTADSRSKIVEKYVEFGMRLGLVSNADDDQQDAVEKVKTWFADVDASWLVIFDNADTNDSKEVLADLWPAGNKGSILITSRDPTFALKTASRHIPEMDEASAVGLLFTAADLVASGDHTADEELIAAQSVVKKVGCVPIAINQAGQLIAAGGNTLNPIAEFDNAYGLRELLEDAQDVPTIQGSLNYRHTLSTVWKLSFTRLDNDQTHLLNIMSFLDPDRAQLSILSSVVKRASIHSAGFLATDRAFMKARTGLLKSSLIEQNEQMGELRMHRVIQASCHLHMDKPTYQQAFAIAFSIIEACWPVTPPDRRHDKGLWPGQQACLEHVQALSEHFNDSLITGKHLRVDVLKFSDLLHNAAWYLYERGNLEPAYPLLTTAETLFIRQREDGTDSTLAAIYNARAALETESNMFQEAYDDFNAALKCIERALATGELKRPTVREAFAYGGLGNGLQGLNRYSEAEVAYKKCLDAYVGFKTPLNAISVAPSNLASCLWLQGKLVEARALLDTVIVDRNDTSSYRTGHAMFALGNVHISEAEELQAAGRKDESADRFNQAESIHLQVLNLFQVTLGEKHHKVADAWHKLACHRHRKHDHGSSLKMLQAAIGIYKRSKLFKNELARSVFKYGCVLQDAGQIAEGRDHIHEAESIRRSILGHKWVATTDEAEYDRYKTDDRYEDVAYYNCSRVIRRLRGLSHTKLERLSRLNVTLFSLARSIASVPNSDSRI